VTKLAKEEFDKWTWETVHGCKAQRRIFSDDRSTNLYKENQAFFKKEQKKEKEPFLLRVGISQSLLAA
jgi:hypothetical protein